MPSKTLNSKSRTYLILSVDDSPFIRKFIKISLESINNYTINLIEAEDGYEAFSLIKKAFPDLLITDYNMPRMDGLDLITKIRNEKLFKNIPIILLTGENDEEDVINKFCKDFNIIFLKKPFRQNQLNDVVSNGIRVSYEW